MKHLLFTLLLGTVLVFSFGHHAAALFEGAKDQACQGINLTDTNSIDNCKTNQVSTEGTINNTLRYAINGFSMVVGVIAVIMIIVGGLKYITSSGDSSNVNSAKNTILYAIIGLVVVALAQVILRFVINRVNGPQPTSQKCLNGTTLYTDGSCH